MSERIYTHTEVVTRERAATLGKAANALEPSFSVTAIAESGENYTTKKGTTYQLDPDHVGVRVTGPSGEPLHDLADRIEKAQRRAA